MAKYIKALDVWAYSDAIRTGQIKLQKGQWISLGTDNPKLSRFHSANPWHIRAFHYPHHFKRFMEYVKSEKEIKIKKSA